MKSNNLDAFLLYFAENSKMYWPSVERHLHKNKDLFIELATPMTEWAANYIGEGYEKALTDGYSYFVTDVNRSQILYEKDGCYKNKSYEEVYEDTYNNSAHMAQYHWGVYVTTFAWEHHLNIYKFFKENLVSRLSAQEGNILELGSGSGIWGLSALNQLPNWNVTGIDISKTSVDIANKMAAVNNFGDVANYITDDALTYQHPEELDAVISCFLLEHVENPEKLISNMARNLKTGGYAFMTAALTAAEVDHINEFKKESEIVLMAEEAGFRVISYYSGSPEQYPSDFKFLPRSMALFMQKKTNDIW